MDIIDKWEKALKTTEIVRTRTQPLSSYETTNLPYIFLAESSVNVGDTVVRKGEVLVENPALILPGNLPHFEGFDFDKELQVSESTVTTFLLIRNIKFPSYKYNNQTYSLDVQEGSLNKAVKNYADKLSKQEDVYSGLIVGAEDCWQFAVLIFICTVVAKAANKDIIRLLENLRRKN